MDTPTRISLQHTLLALVALLLLQAIAMGIGYIASGSPWRLNAFTAPVAFAVAVGIMHGAVRTAYRAGEASATIPASSNYGA